MKVGGLTYTTMGYLHAGHDDKGTETIHWDPSKQLLDEYSHVGRYLDILSSQFR